MEALPEIEETKADPMQEILERIAQECAVSSERLAEIYEAAKEVIERVARVINEVWARVVEVCGPIINRFVAEAMDALLNAANEHPKWWHLYRYAKKGRTRKKYRRLLMRQLIGKLAAAATV